METAASRQSSYALGHSEQELERLAHQAQVFAPFTRQLFEQAGIGPGMRILDVGSGAGDVSFLAAELGGPGGEVVGVDREVAAVEWAVARAQDQRMSDVKVFEGDPAVMDFDQQFDAVVGRLVLMYYPDPVDTIRKLACSDCCRSQGLDGKFMRRIRFWNRGSDRRLSRQGSTFRTTIHSARCWYATSNQWKASSISPRVTWMRATT